ncbi:MAG: LamG domain-containing protein [Planctomycetes bacterium]|nr:LamG domain-containing protein [Planctomycetota bacterium]
MAPSARVLHSKSLAWNWFHACFTYDGSQRTLYINEVQEDQDAGSHTIPTSSGNLYIGVRQNNGTGNPSGYIQDARLDDVRLYNRALTSDEAQAIYQQ